MFQVGACDLIGLSFPLLPQHKQVLEDGRNGLGRIGSTGPRQQGFPNLKDLIRKSFAESREVLQKAIGVVIFIGISRDRQNPIKVLRRNLAN